MATVSATILQVPPTIDYQGVKLIAWPNLANGDVGDGKALSRFADRSVQISGDFGANGAVTIEGTINGTDWVTLKDEAGVDLRFTSAAIAYVASPTAMVRPKVSGDLTTNITVTMLLRGEV